MRQIFSRSFLHIPVILLYRAALTLGCGSDSICNHIDALSQDGVFFDKRCPSYRNLFHQEPLEAPDSCPDVPAPKNCLADKDCPHGSYCCLSICEGITRCYDPIRDKFTRSAHNETSHHHHHHEKKKERICSGSSSEEKECEWVSSEESVEVSVSEDEDRSGDQTDNHREHRRHDREGLEPHHQRHNRRKGSKHDHKGIHGSHHGKARNHHHTRHDDGSIDEKGSRSNEEGNREGDNDDAHTIRKADDARTVGRGVKVVQPETASTVPQGHEARKAGGFSGYKGSQSGSSKKSNNLWKGKGIKGTDNNQEDVPHDHAQQPDSVIPKQQGRDKSSKKERRTNQKQKHDDPKNFKQEHDVPHDGNAISFIDSIHNSILNFKK